MTIVEAFDLEILEHESLLTHIRRGANDHWVETEALEMKVLHATENAWQDWLSDYGDKVREEMKKNLTSQEKKALIVQVLREFIEEPNGTLQARVKLDPKATAHQIGDELVKRFPGLVVRRPT